MNVTSGNLIPRMQPSLSTNSLGKSSRALDTQDLYERYQAQPWERSLRRLAAETGISKSVIGRISKAEHWVERVTAFDVAIHRGVFNRRRWRARQRKIERWGEEPKWHTRAARHKGLIRLNAQVNRLGGEFPTWDWDSRTLAVARRTNRMWRIRTKGLDHFLQTDGKPRWPQPKKVKPPVFLGSA